MKLSPGAEEVLKRAYTFYCKTDQNELCHEHLFYGLAAFLENEEPDLEWEDEQNELKAFLDGKLVNLGEVRNEMKRLSTERDVSFTSAGPVLRWATKTASAMDAESGTAGADALALAMMEKRTKYTERYWNSKIDLRAAAVRYMKEHARETHRTEEGGGLHPSKQEGYSARESYYSEYDKRHEKCIKRNIKDYENRRDAGKQNKPSGFLEWYKKVRNLNILGTAEPRWASYRFIIQKIILEFVILFAVTYGIDVFFNPNGANPWLNMISSVPFPLLLLFNLYDIGLLFSETSDIRGLIVSAVVGMTGVFLIFPAIQNSFNLDRLPIILAIIMTVLLLLAAILIRAYFTITTTCYVMSKSSNDDLASYAYYHFTAGKAAQSIVYTVFGFATVHYLMQSALPDWLAKGIWILEFVLLLFQGIHFINALKEMDEAVGDKKYLYYVCFHDSLIFLSPTLLFVFLTLLFKWPSMPVWMIVLSVLDVLATAIIEFTFIGTVRQSEEIKKSKTKKRG